MKLNSTSHKVTALAAEAVLVRSGYPTGEIVFKHSETLPFKVDPEEVPKGCEMYPIQNEDSDMGNKYGQHYLFFTVDLISAVKPKKLAAVTDFNYFGFGRRSDLGDFWLHELLLHFKPHWMLLIKHPIKRMKHLMNQLIR